MTRPLRVAVDARSLTSHRSSGQSMRELILRTASSGSVEWDLLTDGNSPPPDLPPAPGCQVTSIETFARRIRGWEQWTLPRHAQAIEADLIHAPSTVVPWWQPIPTIVTIQDDRLWREGIGSAPPGLYRDRLLPSAYRRAAAIITTSESSRHEILSRWPLLQPRLHVVSPGIDERFLDAADDGRPLAVGDREVTEPFLLYVGSSDSRKRALWALQTWWGASASASVSLVVCGVDEAQHANLRRMVPPALLDRLFLAPFLPVEDLLRLYMRAAAVLYPALYEAVGLPVIEAQAVGTPVLFSDVGGLVERRGPTAIVLPVDELPAWVRTVTTLLANAERGQRADRIGQAWARQYSQDAYVERTLAVYAEALAARPQRDGAPATRPGEHGRRPAAVTEHETKRAAS
jgi:glycosyltransferase involved in cell wall biosynthesis